MPDRPEFEEFEALRSAVERSESASDAEALRCAAAEEFERRCYRWVWSQGRPWRGDHTPSWVTPPAWVGSFLSTPRYYLAGLIVVVGFVVVVAGAAIAGVVIILLGLAGVIAWQWSDNLRRWKATASPRCLSCGFDTSGVPRVIDPGKVGGLDLGPLRCPECGRLWPRIPPRISDT